MSLKYQPKKYRQKVNQNKKSLTIIKIVSISIIALSLITISFYLRKSPEAKAVRKNQNIFPATVEPASANLASANAANANQVANNLVNEKNILSRAKTKITNPSSKNKNYKPILKKEISKKSTTQPKTNGKINK